MIKIKDYVRVGSMEEAYELNQKRSACILGGMLWTKMGQRQVQTAIDLSGLGLDQIEESEEEFSIGCMVTVRHGRVCGVLSGCSSGIWLRWEAVFSADLDFRMC